MSMPYASTIIVVLRAVLNLVETSGHLSKENSALVNLRQAVEQTVSELELVAKVEPHTDVVQPLKLESYKAS